MFTKKTGFHKIGLGFLLCLMWVLTASEVMASDVDVINQNTGTGSTNNAVAEISNETKVAMSNDGQTVNEINLNLNTGSNQANSNSGQSEINTGSGKVELKVENSGNENVLNVGTDGGDVKTVNLINQSTGVDSVNQVALNSNSSSEVKVTNTASNINEVDLNLNSGNNQAVSNGGSVKIETGKLDSAVSLETTGGGNKINISGCQCAGLHLFLENSDTGTKSVNKIMVTVENKTEVSVDNQSVTLNSVSVDLNSGGNSALKNSGSVTIQTGSINAVVNVDNAINQNEIVIERSNDDDENDPDNEVDDPEIGGPDEDKGVPVDEAVPPVAAPGGSSGSSSNSDNGGSSSSGSSGGSSAVGGRVLGAILPETGSPFSLSLWMMGIFLIFMGRYVRLMSGRSPSWEPVRL
jgi:hypothetical protein